MRIYTVLFMFAFIVSLYPASSFSQQTCNSKRQNATAVEREIKPIASRYMDLVISSKIKLDLVKKPILLSHSDILVVKYSNTEYLTHRLLSVQEFVADNESDIDLQDIIRNVFDTPINKIDKLTHINEREKEIIKALKVSYKLSKALYIEKAIIDGKQVYTVGPDPETHTAFIFDTRRNVHLLDYSGVKRDFYGIVSTLKNRGARYE